MSDFVFDVKPNKLREGEKRRKIVRIEDLGLGHFAKNGTQRLEEQPGKRDNVETADSLVA